jgi:hypothetical protein
LYSPSWRLNPACRPGSSTLSRHKRTPWRRLFWPRTARANWAFAFGVPLQGLDGHAMAVWLAQQPWRLIRQFERGCPCRQGARFAARLLVEAKVDQRLQRQARWWDRSDRAICQFRMVTVQACGPLLIRWSLLGTRFRDLLSPLSQQNPKNLR